MDLSHLPERLGTTVDELRDRTAAAMKTDGESVFRELRTVSQRVGHVGERLETLAQRIEELDAERAERLHRLTARSRRTTWPRRLVWILVGTALGAGAAYLGDPDRGRARRAQLSDQLAARARDVGDDLSDQAKMTVDRAKGSAIEAAKDALPEDVPEDPRLLEQRVRSHALGGRQDTTDVIVRIDGPGRVALKGTVPSSQSERELLSQVAEVEGVVDVRSELAVRGG